MVTNEKVCSRCQKFKSADEFYKQGVRLESLCKTCKREARDQKKIQAGSPEKSGAVDSENPASKTASSHRHSYPYEREEIPEYDESIFYPEVAAMALGLTMEDLADITTFVRWHMEQKEKQERKEEK